ncbi:hypothetical protein GUJ93_ZPchr0006g41459 [Zizania palustris]|uniref:Uncharacterized protein n=1 Tax=Zizania palustris TaxID=103762 RepID=A0A8J5S8Y6_ZIZPA|nr:hypothetical protein GUJ93_ZPchr0006g41459 [Zizania palustris]
MAPANGGGFRVLRTARVTPSSPTGEAALPERAMPLTFMDALWFWNISDPVECVFFYRLGADDVDAVLSRLADSLSLALHAFYPLAGRLRLTPGKTNRYELFYQPGDGVAFTVAEHDGVDVDELAADHPREAEKLSQFVPKLPEGGAVFAVQATVLLPSCRGLALGVTVQHVACDGASSTHFLHTWAAACAGVATPPPPPPFIVSRAFIHEREDIYDSFARRLQNQQTRSKPPDVVGKLFATFTLSRETLHSIKDIWTGEAVRRGVRPPRCTSIVAMLAVIWQCFSRATPGSDAEPDRNGRAHLIIPVDLRTRMEPGVPDSKYFGNCVGLCFASAPKKDLIAIGVDGLIAACSEVAAAIDGATSYDPDSWNRYGDRVIEVLKDGPFLSVAGSPRFRVYDVDFGFGRPAKVDIVSVAKTGAIALAEGRSGSGGIEVGIALPLDRMEMFRRCFVDAVAWLSSSMSDTMH